MARMELGELRGRLEPLAKEVIGKRLRHVTLEADKDEDGLDYLRVTVEAKSVDRLDVGVLEKVARALENEINAVDDRFPSVWFSEAA